MKKFIYTLLIGASVYSIVGCKDPAEVTPTPVYSDRSKADDASARNELDKVYSDIEKVFNSEQYSDKSNNMRTTGAILPCGKVTFNTTNFKIDYSKSGVNCGSRVISGNIDVTLLTEGTFADQDAKLKIVYNDYKVLYYTNNQSITYNGTTYVTNTTGGTFIGLFTTTASTVEHKVRGQLELTFDSTGLGNKNVDRVWNIFRKTTYSSDGTQTGITVKVEGDTNIAMDSYIPGEYTMASEYGMSRDNDRFVCNLSTPFMWSNCGDSYAGPYILKQGAVVYTVDLRDNPISVAGITTGTWSATAGYRYNASNNKYDLDGSCDSDGYKLEFALKNSTGDNVYTSSSFQAY